MSLLKFVKKEDATASVAEIYKLMEERVGFVPNVVQFHTASPEFFGTFMQIINHYSEHEVFEPKMVAYIRLLVSNMADASYCIKLQSAVLNRFGVDQDDILKALKDPSEMKLEMKQKAMVLFVLDMMADNLEDKLVRIQRLRELGYSDKDIYEASVLGGIQLAMTKLIKTFEVAPESWMK